LNNVEYNYFAYTVFQMDQKLHMGSLYISYSHKDRDYVQKLAAKLEDEGFEVWIDERLDYGTDWPIEIQKRLDACDALILVMTPRSLVSKWVQNELNRALRKGKPIFPLLLEGSEPWLAVESTQLIDVSGGIMPDERLFGRLALVTRRHKKTAEPQMQPGEEQGKIGTVQSSPSGQPAGSQPVPVSPKPEIEKQPERKRTASKGWWLAAALGLLICLAATVGISIVGVPWLIDRFKTTPPVAVMPPTRTSLPATEPAFAKTAPATAMPGAFSTMSTAVETAPSSEHPWDNWTVTRSFPSPGSGPSGVVRIGEAVWVLVPGDSRLYHLDLDGNIVGEFTVSASQGVGRGLAWDGEYLWEVSWRGVTQFDPATGTESTQFKADMDNVQGIAWDGTGLWVIDRDGNMAQYDQTGQRLRRLALPVGTSGATGLTWAEGGPWVEDLLGKVERFDADFNLLGSFAISKCVNGGPFYYLALYWDGESLWVADPDGNRIYQCTPV
jgi:hypothetical protein